MLGRSQDARMKPLVCSNVSIGFLQYFCLSLWFRCCGSGITDWFNLWHNISLVLSNLVLFYASLHKPTLQPTRNPSEKPTSEPTQNPTEVPSLSPTRNPTTGPTSSPTCAEDGNFNMCIAIDMGSVCSAGCSENSSTCCSNLSNMLEFTKGLITEVGSLSSDEDFSIVHFGTNVTIASALESWRQSIETINQLQYYGGGSNLAGAISSCQLTLAISPPNRKNIMLLMVVGAPSVPEVNPLEAAANAAMNARNQNTAIVPILIEEPNSADGSNVLYLKNEISSDGQVFVSDPVDLNNLQERLFEHLICLSGLS